MQGRVKQGKLGQGAGEGGGHTVYSLSKHHRTTNSKLSTGCHVSKFHILIYFLCNTYIFFILFQWKQASLLLAEHRHLYSRILLSI